jgi:hypothetical protein
MEVSLNLLYVYYSPSFFRKELQHMLHSRRKAEIEVLSFEAGKSALIDLKSQAQTLYTQVSNLPWFTLSFYSILHLNFTFLSRRPEIKTNSQLEGYTVIVASRLR